MIGEDTERYVSEIITDLLDDNEFLSYIDAQNWDKVGDKIYDKLNSTPDRQGFKYKVEVIERPLINLLWNCGIKTDKLFTEIPTNFFYDGPGASSIDKTKIVIPDYITKIGYQAFAWSDYKHIIMSNNVTEIEWQAFANSNLEAITLSKNLKKVGLEVFAGCNRLKSITFNCTEKELRGGLLDSLLDITGIRGLRKQISIFTIDGKKVNIQ